jgi:hypothetical protein
MKSATNDDKMIALIKVTSIEIILIKINIKIKINIYKKLINN